MEEFLKEVDEVYPDSVILHVMNPFASKKAKPSPQENLPPFLFDLFHVKYHKYSIEVLRNLNVNLQITKEQQTAVLKHTQTHSNNRDWFKFRAGRITSSNFKSACSTKLAKPALSLIKTICYPLSVIFQSKSTKYGIVNEKKAKKDYFETMKTRHDNFKIDEVGFCISTKTPEFGASADGIMSCDCCGEGCFEIKCPYRLQKVPNKEFSIKEFAEMKESYLVRVEGSYLLDRNHTYYYQIQLHMYALEKKFCDFIIWCSDFCYTVRYLFDEKFVAEKLSQASKFHKYVIKPELLSRSYTEIHNDAVEIEMFCYCNANKDEEVVQCSNKFCEIQLFHLSCTNFLNYSDQGWICDLCTDNLVEEVN